MKPTRRAPSFRLLVVAIVLGGGLLPVGLVGLWLAETSVRAGEALLSDELNLMLDRIAAAIEQRWELRRGNLLLMAHNAEVANGLLAPADPTRDDSVQAYLSELYEPMRSRLPLVRITDERGEVRWQLEDSLPTLRRPGDASVGLPVDPPLIVREPIVEAGRRLGELEAHVRFASLLPADSATRQVAEASLSITAADGTQLYSGSQAASDSGDLVRVRRDLENPAVRIEVAAPAAPYVDPFRRASLLGTAALLAGAALSLVVTAELARRLTRPLSDLALAADAVARGDLDQRVEPRGPDEVRRLGMGFNAMTHNLRTTLDTMARQKSLAEVGEFAAELAHEVRNALTAVHVDIQRAQKRLDGQPEAELLEQTLEDVRHLDRVVTGALHVARSGRLRSTLVRLPDVLAASERAVATEVARANVRLVRRDASVETRVNGDASALQLLFTNLLLNAVEASPPGGVVDVQVSANGAAVLVEVRDQGSGIPEEHLERVLEPLYSTKPAGTGLGLPIARQIAKAHGGTLSIQNGIGAGVVATVRLPVAGGSEGGRV